MSKRIKGEQLEKYFECSFQVWREKYPDFCPVELVASADKSNDGVNRIHLFKLKGGKYALIRELGCSCYEPADADFNLYSTLSAAKNSIRTMAREGYPEIAKELMLKVLGEWDER